MWIFGFFLAFFWPKKNFFYFFLKSRRPHEQFDTLHLKIGQKLSSQWIFEKNNYFHTFYRFLWFCYEKRFFTENAAIESVFIRFWRVRPHFLRFFFLFRKKMGGLGLRGLFKNAQFFFFHFFFFFLLFLVKYELSAIFFTVEIPLIFFWYFFLLN